eukprot:TRINITY_DN3632_c0_g1_i1.p1 TRINITY_DN3632_c0_g1~~TRINITY_DN3632_c0_g1_i1.p1  ORF type:complete len:552 (-),score=129.02 TRINITY_DN3632_c0_g1_i1:231-1886(-)
MGTMKLLKALAILLLLCFVADAAVFRTVSRRQPQQKKGDDGASLGAEKVENKEEGGGDTEKKEEGGDDNKEEEGGDTEKKEEGGDDNKEEEGGDTEKKDDDGGNDDGGNDDEKKDKEKDDKPAYKCKAPPETEGYKTKIDSMASNDFKVNVTCKEHYSGENPKAVKCEKDGEVFGLEGCAADLCASPDDNAFKVEEKSLRRHNFSVEAECADNFMGEAKVTMCSEKDKPYNIKGCYADGVTAVSCKGANIVTKGVVTYCTKKTEEDKDYVDYEDAVTFCEGRGLRLAEPTTPKKADALNQLCAGDTRCTWLSMTCPDKNDGCKKDYTAWKWTRTNTEVEATYNGFLPFELKDGGEITGAGKDRYCAAHGTDKGAYSWVPYKCDGSDKKHGVACEAFPQPVTKAKCTGDGVELLEAGDTNFCYKKGEMTYTAAEKFCTDLGLQLVEPSTAEKIAAVDSVCKSDCTWLGLKCTGNPSDCTGELKLWQWVTSGYSLESGLNKFVKPNGGIIEGSTVGQQCSYYKQKVGDEGKWGTKNCDGNDAKAGGALCEPRA